MLVLTRKSGESVLVGDDVAVRVLGVKGNQVSLGFEAPREVRIYREEVLREVEASNRQAQVTQREALEAAERALKEKIHE